MSVPTLVPLHRSLLGIVHVGVWTLVLRHRCLRRRDLGRRRRIGKSAGRWGNWSANRQGDRLRGRRIAGSGSLRVGELAGQQVGVVARAAVKNRAKNAMLPDRRWQENLYESYLTMHARYLHANYNTL
ncbi:MAG: hypothetical protein AAF471_09410 [Myxococcota bacterium]